MSHYDVSARKEVPVISRLPWEWTLALTGFTGGLLFLGMPIYISWWVRNRRKTGLAFYAYVALALLLTVGLIPTAMLPKGLPWDSIGTTAVLLWLANAFVLRRELMLYYASPEGGVLEISPWLTGLFSVYYLNYCLWVVRDSA
jgi:hypothetical protein